MAVVLQLGFDWCDPPTIIASPIRLRRMGHPPTLTEVGLTLYYAGPGRRHETCLLKECIRKPPHPTLFPSGGEGFDAERQR